MSQPSTPEKIMTGLGVKVAVIDSGVNPRHPHIRPVAGGVTVRNGGEIDESTYMDVLGHGTAVMAAIQEKAPDASYHAVKVFNSSLSTSSFCLIRAIQWCVDHNVDVINLSLGTVNSAHAGALTHAVQRASEAGTLLVAAREANGQPCYPGSLPGVFSVACDTDCDRNSYRFQRVGDQTIFYASGYPRPVPGVPPQRNLNGISFAVANMSAFVIRACQQAGTLELRSPKRAATISELLQIL